MLDTSAARKFERKIAKFLKTSKDLHQSNFKISKDLHQRPPKSQKYLHQSSKFFVKNRFKQVFMTIFKKSPKRSQISKSPNQNTERQMVQKIAQMAPNCQIWQHCLIQLNIPRALSWAGKRTWIAKCWKESYLVCMLLNKKDLSLKRQYLVQLFNYPANLCAFTFWNLLKHSDY